MSDPGIPVIGRPTAPPQALVVAVTDRFAPMVRAARVGRFVRCTLVLAGLVALCAGVVAVAALAADAARGALLMEGVVFGALIFLGAVLEPRPLEVGPGLSARSAEGGFLPLEAMRAAVLIVPAVLRGALEGLLYGTGIIRHDPAAELAAWLVLALAPPHGPGPGEWVSLEGVAAAGLYSLPEDLRPALGALSSCGWIAVDRGRYPPRVRLEEAGREFVLELVPGRARAPD